MWDSQCQVFQRFLHTLIIGLSCWIPTVEPINMLWKRVFWSSLRWYCLSLTLSASILSRLHIHNANINRLSFSLDHNCQTRHTQYQLPPPRPNKKFRLGSPDHSLNFQQARRLPSSLSANVKPLCQGFPRSIMHHEYNLGRWPRNNQNSPLKPPLCSPSLPDSQELYLTFNRSNHLLSVSPRVFTAFLRVLAVHSFRSC